MDEDVDAALNADLVMAQQEAERQEKGKSKISYYLLYINMRALAFTRLGFFCYLDR